MTTDKARAEAENMLRQVRPFYDLLNKDQREHLTNRLANIITARDAEASAKLARVEAAMVKWQHEAEGLREAVRVLAEDARSTRAYDDHEEGDMNDYHPQTAEDLYAKVTAARDAVNANPIAKAALDAAGGAQ